MRIAFDTDSMQVKVHLSGKPRLTALKDHIRKSFEDVSFHFVSLNNIASISSPSTLLIVTTHYPKPYGPKQIQEIVQSVEEGMSLLLMSNHGDLPGRNNHDDTRRHDDLLAAKFGIHIECSWFTKPGQNELAVFEGNMLNKEHPIISGGGVGREIRSVVINNCSSLVSPEHDYVVKLGAPLVDCRDSQPPEGRAFAIAYDNGSTSGRVVALADSGFIGSAGTQQPGPGLSNRGDNLEFVTNVLYWLSRKI